MREGEAVKAGQVLARLDTADLEAKLTDRIGALEASRAQLALAEKTRTQNHALLKQGFISQNAYDSAESNLSVTQGTLKSYEAQVQLARNALRDAVVTAPLSGTLAKRHVQPGEKVNFDSPLFTIVDLAKMELQAMVPANDIPEISLGMAVELSIDGFGDRAFAGSVERINPMTEAGTRAILVFVQIPNPDAALKGGMFATGRIRLAAGSGGADIAVDGDPDRGGADLRLDHRGRQADPPQRVTLGRRDEAAAASRSRIRCPSATQVLAARFDNLKDGASASRCARPRRSQARRRGLGATSGRSCGSRASRSTTRCSPTMVMVGITVLGLFSYARLRVEQMPDVSLPFVFVMTVYPGASPEVVETDVTKPLEYAINTVAGRQDDPLDLARRPKPGLRRVPARHRHDARDAGRARQDRAGQAGLSARREGPAGRLAPIRRTSNRWCRSRSCRRP